MIVRYDSVIRAARFYLRKCYGLFTLQPKAVLVVLVESKMQVS